jgi:hypothetical protein
MNSADAKQFLIGRVIEEAELQQVSLSEVERKMLYFTEVSPSLPDIYDVNAEFERNYDAASMRKKSRLFSRTPAIGMAAHHQIGSKTGRMRSTR